MLKKMIISLATLVMFTAQAGNKNNVTIAGGEVSFLGKVVNAACAVSFQSKNQTISLGKVSTNQLPQLGGLYKAGDFEIQLDNCDLNTSQLAQINFKGVSDVKDPLILSVGDEKKSARGIGIAIYDSEDNFIPINQNSRTTYPLNEGLVKLKFIAKYKTTSREVVAGKVLSYAYFTVNYI